MKPLYVTVMIFCFCLLSCALSMIIGSFYNLLTLNQKQMTGDITPSQYTQGQLMFALISGIMLLCISIGGIMFAWSQLDNLSSESDPIE